MPTFIYSNPLTLLRAAKLACKEAEGSRLKMSGWSRKLDYTLGVFDIPRKGQSFRGVSLWVWVFNRRIAYKFLISEENLAKHLDKVPESLRGIFGNEDSLTAVQRLPKTRLTLVLKPWMLPGADLSK